MRYLIWLLRIAVFIVLLGFAIKNDQPVTLRYFLGYEWNASLVVVLLCFFAAGAVIGILAMLGPVLRLRRQLSVAQRDVKSKNRIAHVDETSELPIQPS